MKQSKFIVFTAAVLSMCFWALSFIWYKEVLVLYRPITLVLLRLIISSSLLVITTLLVGRLQKMKRTDISRFLLLAFFQPFFYFLCESYGVSMVSSTLAAVIISTIPLFSPIGAYFLLGERITVVNFLGILVSILGVALVAFHTGFGNMEVNFNGVLLLFGAVVAAIGYAIVLRRLGGKYNAFTIVAYQNSLGILYFLPLFLVFDFQHFISVIPSRSVIVPLLNLGIFSSTLAFVLFTYVVKKINVTRANVFTNSIPVLTAIFAYFLIGESISLVKAIGIVVALCGVFIAQTGRVKARG